MLKKLIANSAVPARPTEYQTHDYLHDWFNDSLKPNQLFFLFLAL